jgi:2-polyprenyl-3-methyl-5-hydroxy-6-metoxy-1,4-benzoquinol methylase
MLPVQAPYRWNLRRLDLGFTLDVGCGIGRNLHHLDANGVGTDHNRFAVDVCRAAGLRAYTSDEFLSSPYAKPSTFDSLLVAHVLEHMTELDAVDLVRSHVVYVRPSGSVVLITPQERGHQSDATHVQFMDLAALRAIATSAGLVTSRAYSFPFPRAAGRLFVYNEFVLVARVPGDG